jgi:hypothetical protein
MRRRDTLGVKVANVNREGSVHAALGKHSSAGDAPAKSLTHPIHGVLKFFQFAF